jgi:hypothetical protein
LVDFIDERCEATNAVLALGIYRELGTTDVVDNGLARSHNFY